MKRLFRSLLLRFRQWRAGQTFPISAPEWTPEHQAHLNQFLASPTGLALLARGRAVAAETAIRACHDSFSPQHSAARVAGFCDALKWLESLSRSSRASEESSHDQGQNTDTLPPGETALREFMSP